MFHAFPIIENIAAAPGVGAFFESVKNKRSFQAILTGVGALTATVKVYGSNDGVNVCSTEMGTITLNGNDTVSDGFVTDEPWKYVQAQVTAITGTSAKVKVLLGE